MHKIYAMRRETVLFKKKMGAKMTELLTSAQMRSIEAAAMASGKVTGIGLMERAGQGVVAAIFEQWPALRAKGLRALVLCGPGNNGGDGFVIARLLHEAGWEVEVLLFGDSDRLPPDARVNYERWLGMGQVTQRRLDPPPLADDGLELKKLPALLVDAVFGIGLTRPMRGVLTALTDEAVQQGLHKAGVKRVAVDIPSGLNADTGLPLGQHVLPADLTVTFHRPKPAHLHPAAAKFCGRVVVCDIGLAAWDKTGGVEE